MASEIALPTADEVARFALAAIEATGIREPLPRMNRRFERVGRPAEVRVCARLGWAHGNCDSPEERYLEPFTLDDRAFVLRQIVRSHRPWWRCELAAPWVLDEDAAREIMSGEVDLGGFCLSVETPLLSRDRRLGLIRCQRQEPYGAEDFSFVLRDRDGTWEVEPWEITP